MKQLSELIKDRQEIERLYQEAELLPRDGLDKWASSVWKFHSGLVRGQKRDNIVLFDNGLVYDIRKKDVFLYSSRDSKYKIPRSLFVFENNILKETVYPNHDLDLSVLMLKNQEELQVILLNTQLAKSLFVRLYFFNGAGLKYFKPFIEERLGDDYIRVFEIDWEQK